MVAESGGWRLAVSHPAGGATIARVTAVCYEIAGTSREPVVALEVSLIPPGSNVGTDPVQVDASVGRGSVHVRLPASTGRYDLRVQLIANGERLHGVVVTIPRVTLADGASSGTCP